VVGLQNIDNEERETEIYNRPLYGFGSTSDRLSARKAGTWHDSYYSVSNSAPGRD
jgi:hypothetical protein